MEKIKFIEIKSKQPVPQISIEAWLFIEKKDFTEMICQFLQIIAEGQKQSRNSRTLTFVFFCLKCDALAKGPFLHSENIPVVKYGWAL